MKTQITIRYTKLNDEVEVSKHTIEHNRINRQYRIIKLVNELYPRNITIDIQDNNVVLVR